MLFAGHVIPLTEASEVNGVVLMTGSQPMPATTMPPFAGAVLEENIGGQCPPNRGADWRAPKAGETEWGWVWGGGCPLPSRVEGLGSIESSPSGIRG